MEAEQLFDRVEHTKRQYRVNPRDNYDAYAEAWDKVKAYAQVLRERLAGLGVAMSAAHAYTPRETGSHGGAEHFVVNVDIKEGRLKRSEGDALCRTRDKFWGLMVLDDRVVTCKTCILRAERLLARLEKESV